MSEKLPSVFLIPQAGIKKYGLPNDIKIWLLLSNIRFWYLQNISKSKVIEGKKYIWINYRTIIKTLPILGTNDKNSLVRWINKLKKLGLVDKHQSRNRTLYVHLTDFAKLIYDEDQSTKRKTNIGSNQDSYIDSTIQTYHGKCIQHNKYSCNKEIIINSSNQKETKNKQDLNIQKKEELVKSKKEPDYKTNATKISIISEIKDLNSSINPMVKIRKENLMTESNIKKALSDLEHIKAINRRKYPQIYESAVDTKEKH